MELASLKSFTNAFQIIIPKLKQYLNIECSIDLDVEEMDIWDVLLQINKQSSTSKGVRGAPPLLQKFSVIYLKV